MRALYVLENVNQDTAAIDDFEGEELFILILANPSALANEFDGEMEALREKAILLARKVSMNGVKPRLLIEWGEREEVVRNALEREKCVLI
ncbi:MAG TPA: hypothetical protein VGQ00_03800 [Candidatus Norongarragalinales archaeon]|jgi:hypothetical protein|nr:hypothetical protein [Candidatus Norongarragalinales archaeon]